MADCDCDGCTEGKTADELFDMLSEREIRLSEARAENTRLHEKLSRRLDPDWDPTQVALMGEMELETDRLRAELAEARNYIRGFL